MHIYPNIYALGLFCWIITIGMTLTFSPNFKY